MQRDAWQRWARGYEDAWRSHRGLPAIGRLWEAEREGPGEIFTLVTEIVAVEGGTGVVRAEVAYGDPLRQRYLDMWVITLDSDGRCSAFEEWPFWPPDATTASEETA